MITNLTVFGVLSQHLRKSILSRGLALLGFDLCSVEAIGAEAPAVASPGDAEWAAVTNACHLPTPPAEWQQHRPSPAEIASFREAQSKRATEAANVALGFYTKFPKHPKAAAAKAKDFEMSRAAYQLGNTNQLTHLLAVEADRLKDPGLSEDDRLEIRVGAIQRNAMLKQSEGTPAMMAEYETGVRSLRKEFPKRPEVYQMMLEIASNSQTDKAIALAKELLASDAPEETKTEAKTLLKKFDAVGKPLALSFAAVDGRQVDLAKMKDKVVLVDFWATWCGPCVGELPHVKAAYDKLHEKGFEIVGISFDQNKEALEKFVADKQMAWPQFFDGKGWQNQFGQEFGIQSIPAMWLVDKKGNLRDLNGREDLAAKVEKLLAE